MREFSKLFNLECKELIKSYGFKKSRPNHYYRIINDVLQIFELEFIFHGTCARVNFGVEPIYSPIPIGLEKYFLEFGAKYELNRFDSIIGFEFKRNSEGIIMCVQKIKSYMKKYLFPFFDRAIDSKLALKEVILFERNFKKICKNWNRENGIEIDSKDSEINYNDSSKYYMALKNKMYNFAKIFLEFEIKLCTEACVCESNMGVLTEARKKRFEDIVIKNKYEISKLEERDTLYFNNIIESNEARFFELLENKQNKRNSKSQD